MLGTCVFPVTCSSQMGLSDLQRVLSGLVQSGCWAVFDNTDRLTVELMSSQTLSELYAIPRRMNTLLEGSLPLSR